MTAGDLIRVHVDTPKETPDFSFIAFVMHISPFLLQVYCPEDGKIYTIPEEWCETL
tara:strand:+ start:85 stop:252 length:168 start_codon:yes stop_codon:yes gene_type:complete